jgi:hypothetical protein
MLQDFKNGFVLNNVFHSLLSKWQAVGLRRGPKREIEFVNISHEEGGWMREKEPQHRQ